MSRNGTFLLSGIHIKKCSNSTEIATIVIGPNVVGDITNIEIELNSVRAIAIGTESEVTIQSSVFTKNTPVDSKGGAIFAENKTTLIISESEFSGEHSYLKFTSVVVQPE